MPLFGTDGVRGLANGPLTADLALTLAQATAVVLGQGRTAEARKAAGKRLTAVVARDPRVSGEFLAAAVSAGLASSGVDVLDAGVLPTPATAYLIADIEADFGVMVSASHNPAPDNGIKIFARGGVKLPDVVEQRIEHAMTLPKLQPTGAGVGRIRRFADAEDRYVVHLLASLPHRLDGLHVVLDCAHGAASGVSPETFRDAGARVTVIGADPDGLNINDGVGSTHLDSLAEQVVRVRRRRRHRARRRRRPLPRGGRARPRRRRRPDHGDPRGVDEGARTPRGRHARRDRDEQPRTAPGDGRPGHHASCRPASATATCSRR